MSVHAQLVADGATNRLSNVTIMVPGSVIIGTNGSFTLLTLSDNTLVTNSPHLVIGANTTAKSNQLQLISPTARWLVGGTLGFRFLMVGSNGASSRLVVSNGALLANNGSAAFIGFNDGTSNNVAVVTGAGSVWSNTFQLSVGQSGLGNQLIVTNGGQVLSADGRIGSVGSNNLAVVTGVGSQWDNKTDFYVGVGGEGNRLQIENGGLLGNGAGYVGANSTSRSNEVMVTGAGSLWSNRLDLQIGQNGAFNRLTVNNGGSVVNSNGIVGVSTIATSNEVVVTGANSTWSNSASLFVGAAGPGNQLLVSAGGLVVAASGSLGQNATASANTAEITDTGSEWRFSGNFNVGSGGSFNRLLVSGGARVSDHSSIIGGTASGSNNSAIVSGPGSLWMNSSDLTVGLFGERNELLVSNGGMVASPFGGVGDSAAHNLAVVTGSGSTWSNDFNLNVGYFGHSNRVRIQNGALLVSGSGSIGNTGRSNEVSVTGTGSLWNNPGDLVVGFSGRLNQLLVTDGATALTGGNASIGVNAGGSSNAVVTAGLGARWLVASNLYVGTSGSFNRLVVNNGGWAVNSNAFLGCASTASNNSAFVIGAGSVWSNRNQLTVGSNSPGNRLEVLDGGRVFVNRDAFVGRSASSSSNSILVSGPGSVWTNASSPSSLFVGDSGAGNQLVVSNGAVVSGYEGIIGSTESSSNNQAVVTGSGSLWSYEEDLFAGNDGRNNLLLVSDGGSVRGRAGNVGFNASSSDNLALITGAGSTWSNAFSLIVGNAGRANRLIVTNGGTVTAGNLVLLGLVNSSSNNRVVVQGGTLRVTNASVTGALDVRRGTNVFNAGLIEVDVLRMTNALGKFEFNGGTLITRGAVISNNTTFTVGNAGSVPAVWDVQPGVSNHYVAGEVFVGGAGSFAQLIHTNGALLTNAGYAALGIQAASRSNTVTLAGSGSRWWLGDGVLVGDGGSGNRLVVRDGASLVTASISYFGDDKTSTNNEAVVTGSGSSWFTANFGLRVGYEGPNNRLLVSGGGVVTSFDDRVGNDLSSSNNQVLVTGSGSLWNNTRELSVGLNSSGNQLVVSNGGTVFTAANKYVGQNVGALSNTVIVTGPGSAWLGDDSLYVGPDGSSNRLFVRNGGRVTSGIATLGATLAANGNQALITDAGSVWSNRFDLNVGDGGSANHLVISDSGAIVSARDGFIGRASGANSNAVILTDLGTRWLLSSNLYVGSNGAFSQLVISNGARVENGRGSIGTGFSSSNNLAVVTGSGSVWSNARELFIGVDGRGNQLVVSNGGVVISSVGSISANSGGRSNLVVVTGSGSVWSNANSLTISGSGGNRLAVSEGALVRSSSGFIGTGTSASNNTVLVTGLGSEWRTTFNMSVGASSPGNQLVVSNDGVVLVGNGLDLGSSSSSTNNRVVIDGGTLRTTNSLGISDYDIRRGTNVLNAGLIETDLLRMTNGTLSNFEFNGGTLSISKSRLSTGLPLIVGNGVSSATLILAGNGTHDFTGTLGLILSSNATLTGNGSLIAQLQVRAGSQLVPGTSVGKISLSTPPFLLGTVAMELSKNGAALTNDQLEVTGTLTYGGSLIVSNRGPDALVAGNQFRLFAANNYSGSFSNMTLPPLASGLTWTNRLLVDGSIQVVSVAPPGFSSVSLSGTNLILSGTNGSPNASYAVLTATNVALPGSNWVSVVTNQFDASGDFLFTWPINPEEPERYFWIRTP